MAGSTLTTTSVSIPVTRGRPFSFTIDVRALDPSLVLDKSGVVATAVVAWDYHRVPGVVDQSEEPWVASWTAESLDDIPSTPAPQLLLTLTEENGTIHDFIVPLATRLVPL